jgi:hypothetical protein
MPGVQQSVQAVKYIEQYKNEATGTIRFKDKMVGVCKCNEKDLIGEIFFCAGTLDEPFFTVARHRNRDKVVEIRQFWPDWLWR